ncbi:hypothetical protein LTR62_006484 [Meristemomyces frigidus]|uniref:Domain of unknown function at the cortex 1 domain-containing protein n=1 Tax=Meristemomyces frigidus TaxID=1508187 RepID=A0AAN7TC12_9PEZI|nr:hypothetical protein LTR62_006484 [Meristemomyces frigidus]
MASVLKSKLHGLTGGGEADNGVDAEQEAEKYRLLVTAGPSYNQAEHQTVGVNTNQAICVENEFMRAKIKVNIKGYHGLPSSSPASSTYFDDPAHKKDQYSVAFSFVPKRDLPSLDAVWGNDFDHPVRNKLPPGFNTAFKIVKEFIDPGLECDAYADKPWLYGPSLSCWFAFRIGDKVGESADFPAPGKEEVVKEGGDGQGNDMRHELGLPETSEKRRKYFLSAPHREAFVFEKDRVYLADFYNPYIDFPNFSLKLPGFTLKVIKYIDQKSHCLRYVFKNRKTGDVYFSVHIHLLWGEKLQEAIQSDGNEQSRSGGQNASASQPSAVVGGSGQGRSVPERQQAEGREQADENARRSVEMRPAESRGDVTGPPVPPQRQEPTTTKRNVPVQPTVPQENGTSSSTTTNPGPSPVPATMQLQAGNQAAGATFDPKQESTDMPRQESSSNPVSTSRTAEQVADFSSESAVTRMLQDTSTSDQQGAKTNVFHKGLD